MNSNKESDDKIVLCLSDIIALLQRSKKKIFLWACLLSALGIFLALIKPISYESQGTLREKVNVGDMSSGVSAFAQIMTLGASEGASHEIYSITRSRKLLKPIIEEYHLQANLEPIDQKSSLFQNIINNLKALRANLLNSPRSTIKQASNPLKLEKLIYEGENFHAFSIHLKEDGSFAIIDKADPTKEKHFGYLDQPFDYQTISLILSSNHADQPLKAQEFILTIRPIESVVKSINANLDISSSVDDSSLLVFKFQHEDRALASSLINSIMYAYEKYLKEQQLKTAKIQLDYLNDRRNFLTTNLKDLMQEHAAFLSEDIFGTGLLDAEKEMDFLAANQQKYKEKLLQMDVEIKRLSHMKDNDIAFYDRFSTADGDSTVINPILSKIRELKQMRDTFEIEVQKKSLTRSEAIDQTFNQQLTELSRVQDYIQQIKKIISAYQSSQRPDENTPLLNDSRFMLRNWFDRLDSAKMNDPSNYRKIQENFQFYLVNLERLFGVHERVLQERLSHQQNPSGEFQGITLEGATSIYLRYSNEMIEQESEIRQNLFLINQIKDPNFEITSLSGCLKDPVSCEMIDRARTLVLNLRDSNNQSSREQERIKDELNLQRTFLAMHLEQMIQLIELNQELLKEKIYALQNVSLDLTHQQISLLEKNLRDYIDARIINLQQEQELIKDHLKDINRELANLPKKWVSEKLIDQQFESNKLIVQEIVKLVEAKNISHNLEIIKTAPLDLALSKLHPKSPPVFLYGILGFFLGTLLASLMALNQIIRQGLPVSSNNLSERGLFVAGTFSPLSMKPNETIKTNDLATLRRLKMYFDESESLDRSMSKQGQVISLLQQSDLHLSDHLIKLAQINGTKTLMIDLDLNKEEQTHSSDLLHYLNHKVDFPTIHKTDLGDQIYAGGTSPFGVELFSSKRFLQLIDQLSPLYDMILMTSAAASSSPEAEKLVTLFNYSIITLKNESVDSLDFYQKLLNQQPQKKLAFVIVT